jgi:HEPN domain-containing protein
MINEVSQILINKANDDLQLVENELSLTSRNLLIDICVFHCQQAVEKYLKAYLNNKGFLLPKTHDLQYLKQKCLKFNSEFNEFDVIPLTQFAVDIRYSQSIFQITKDELLVFFDLAKKIKDFVINELTN